MMNRSGNQGNFKVSVLAGCVFEPFLPFIKFKSTADHALCFQIPIGNILNDKGKTIGTQVGSQYIQFLSVLL